MIEQKSFATLPYGDRLFDPRFGDLSDPASVQMPAKLQGSYGPLVEPKDTVVHLTITPTCNARCRGCINRSITYHSLPSDVKATALDSDPERDAGIITQLALRHPDRTLMLAFYGGEPLLMPDKMNRIFQILDKSSLNGGIRYMVYTSGDLIGQALDEHARLMSHMWLYSVSIDGDREQHNRVRPGTDLEKIEHNLGRLKTACESQVLMWSTLREEQSLLKCYKQFRSLYGSGKVGHFFWHFADSLQPYEDLKEYALAYGQELQEVISDYCERLRGGQLVPVAHLNELVIYLLSGRKRGHTACAVEISGDYDIVGGRIYACADLPPTICPSYDISSLIDIPKSTLASLVSYRHDLGCFRCGIEAYCGGRCPVQALAGSEIRTRQLCQLLRLHVAIVSERLDDIADSLRRNDISLQDIYDRSAYITRYTDVIP